MPHRKDCRADFGTPEKKATLLETDDHIWETEGGGRARNSGKKRIHPSPKEQPET